MSFCNTLVYMFSFDTKVISKLHFHVPLTQKSTLDRSVFSTIGSGNTDKKNVIYFYRYVILKNTFLHAFFWNEMQLTWTEIFLYGDHTIYEYQDDLKHKQ